MKPRPGIRSRSLWLCLALSLVLHLLGGLLVPLDQDPEIRPRYLQSQRVRLFEQLEAFSGAVPKGAIGALERLSSPAITLPQSIPIEEGSDSSPVAIPQTDAPQSLRPLAGQTLPKPLRFESHPVVLSDLDSLALDALIKTAEEREKFVRLHTSDADTTDAESQSRRKARRIVERAITAMGGRPALLAIKERRVRVWVEAWRDVKRTFPRMVIDTVPPYPYPVETMRHKGWDTFVLEPLQVPQSLASVEKVETYMMHNPFFARQDYHRLFDDIRWSFLPQPSYQLRRQGRIARWHFIDRFLGEGVVLDYIGRKNLGVSGARDLETILVDDRKYGHYIEASFNDRTGLLHALRERLSPPEQVRYRQEYNRDPPMWTTVYSAYKPVEWGPDVPRHDPHRTAMPLLQTPASRYYCAQYRPSQDRLQRPGARHRAAGYSLS